MNFVFFHWNVEVFAGFEFVYPISVVFSVQQKKKGKLKSEILT